MRSRKRQEVRKEWKLSKQQQTMDTAALVLRRIQLSAWQLATRRGAADAAVVVGGDAGMSHAWLIPTSPQLVFQIAPAYHLSEGCHWLRVAATRLRSMLLLLHLHRQL